MGATELDLCFELLLYDSSGAGSMNVDQLGESYSYPLKTLITSVNSMMAVGRVDGLI